jgi:hypothetical protein
MKAFRRAIISVLPLFARTTPPCTDQVMHALLLMDQEQSELEGRVILRSVSLLPSVGTASLEIMEALSDREPSPKVAALISIWASDLDPYDAEISATVASYGRQELIFESFIRHPVTQKVIRCGPMDVGAIAPVEDLLHSALNLGLAAHSRQR